MKPGFDWIDIGTMSIHPGWIAFGISDTHPGWIMPVPISNDPDFGF